MNERTRALVTMLTTIPLWLAGLILVAIRNTAGWAEFFANSAAEWTTRDAEGRQFWYPSYGDVNWTMRDRFLEGADTIHG